MPALSSGLVKQVSDAVYSDHRRRYPVAKITVDALEASQMAAFIAQEREAGNENGMAQRASDALQRMSDLGVETLIFGVTIKAGNGFPIPRFAIWPFFWGDPVI